MIFIASSRCACHANNNHHQQRRPRTQRESNNQLQLTLKFTYDRLSFAFFFTALHQHLKSPNRTSQPPSAAPYNLCSSKKILSSFTSEGKEKDFLDRGKKAQHTFAVARDAGITCQWVERWMQAPIEATSSPAIAMRRKNYFFVVATFGA